MADEEPVDQKKYVEESCKPKCVKPLLEYRACIKRIEGDESGHKHCTGQYFDYWACVDKCTCDVGSGCNCNGSCLKSHCAFGGCIFGHHKSRELGFR